MNAIADNSLSAGETPAARSADAQTGTIVLVLSVDETSALLEHEATIRNGLKTFVDVGNALARIRDSKLYRGEFGTFEDYCRAKWDISDRHARHLWSAAEVVGELAGRNFTVLPTAESQARPLTKLPREEWVPAWEEILGTAPAGKVTASHVEDVVQRRKDRLDRATPKAKPIEAGKRDAQIDASAAAAQAELRALQDLIGTADGCVTANVATAVYHIDALREHLARVKTMQANRKASV